MKLINLKYPNTYKNNNKVVLIMGYFDGIHLGHQAVIKTGKKIAKEKNLSLALLTYRYSPKSFYSPNPDLKLPILSFEKKIEKIKKLGVNYLFIIDYDSSFARQKPQDFVDNYIVKMGALVVVAGFDHTYGSNKSEANMSNLPYYAKGRFQVVSVKKRTDSKKKISSTRIRKLLDMGDIKGADKLLGYKYKTIGIVKRGRKIGRTLGFPTANQDLFSPQLLPKNGVYVVRIKIFSGKFINKSYGGMASIGNNETIKKNNPLTIEINIFDFIGNIYGEKISVTWIKFLRAQKKFSSLLKLKNQLQKDKIESKKILL